MALFSFTLDLTRTADALDRVAAELKLAREALERLAPPLAEPATPELAKLSDLRSTDPHTIAPITQDLEEFAREHNVVIHSEAFIDSIMRFEREVSDVYGPEAVLELPWNRTAGGRLFAVKADKG